MLIKIKSTAGAEHTKDKYNDTLSSLRGQWVKVNTDCLFNNQYNLLDYDIRVFDNDIDAVKDDIRAGMVKCGYCGKQFSSRDELIKHYLEEENSAHQCENCRDYVTGIINIACENKTERDDDGNKIETRTTKYVYGKKCRWDACNKFCHRNYKPSEFTKENTFFLKYPDGYAAYFKALPITDQWREIGYAWSADARTATKTNAIGTYSTILHYTDSGQLEGMSITNARTAYHINSEDIKNILSHYYAIDYLLEYDESRKKRDAENPLKGFPKSLDRAKYKYFDGLRDMVRDNDYKHSLIIGSNN